MDLIKRFFGWGAASASMAAMSGTCPCCGNGLCPQGLAMFGIAGALVGCALRLFYRPTDSQSEAAQSAPNSRASHGLALDLAERQSGDSRSPRPNS